MFVVVVVKFLFFSCRHANGRERDFCLLFCFVCFFVFSLFLFASNQTEEEEGFRYTIVSSFLHFQTRMTTTTIPHGL